MIIYDSADRRRTIGVNGYDVAAQPVRHPIQRLHPELLAELFTHCIPEEVVNGVYNSVSIRDAPLLLCRVHYRSELATAHSRAIQARIEITSRGIRTWLGRSGALPLTIRFVLSARKEIIINALEALFEFSSRWENIIIDVSPSVPWPNVGVLPALQVFDGSFLPITQFPFTSAPSLKVLQVYILPLNPVSISRIPWGQLTELIVNLMAPILAVLDILRGCPLLEMLTILIGNDMVNDTSSSLPLPSALQIKHDTLRWLWLYVSGPDSGAITVEYLTLPALKDLRLSGWSGEKIEPYCYSQVLNFLTRSRCNLERLAIMKTSFEPINLLEYLKHPSCQTLTYLHINEYDKGGDDVISVLNDQVLSQLTYSEEQGKAPLCPKLADLYLEECYRSEVGTTASALGRMIRSRCFGRASDERLRSLHLVTLYQISSEDNELLQLAHDEGGLRLSYEAMRYNVVPSNPCYKDWCYVSGQEDVSEEDLDDDGSDEELDDDGSEEDTDDDGSEEDSDNDGRKEDLDERFI
ncbi:hypothetical protein APHAL10511_000458 [Amanita phalloides]|nr:hypothetical protein APHAL10511_000458 [Amanita phalloides]